MKIPKLFLSLFVILCFTSYVQAVKQTEVDKLLGKLTSAHTKVFSKDDLFSEQLKSQDWYLVMNDVKEFIAKNARKDKYLTNTLNEILKSNDNLVNTIKIAYNSLFAPGTTFQSKVATQLLSKIDAIAKKMTELQSSIKSKYFWYASKKESQDALELTALFIGDTAKEASRQLREKIKKNHK